jgi:hypothetical protein
MSTSASVSVSASINQKSKKSTRKIIFPAVLFVAVWDGRDRENLPSGYKSDLTMAVATSIRVFKNQIFWVVGGGWMDGGTSTNFALTYVLDTKIQSDFSQFCPFQTDFSQFCHFQRW